MTRAGYGLSPRVRGNRSLAPSNRLDTGSIPACAGEPANNPSMATTSGVYPRVCGGTADISSGMSPCQGLSPRVRGNRRQRPMGESGRGSIPACAGEPIRRHRRLSLTRSIPACAGEPSTEWPCTSPLKVYPRVCGGTMCCPSVSCPSLGLSPRVRGNPLQPLCLPPIP